MTDSDEDNISSNDNKNNVHKYNNMLNKYLQEYKTSEISNNKVVNRESHHNKH